MVLKKISVATAVTISGTMIGRLISPKVADLPRNEPPRTIAIAADVAIMVEAVAARMAIVTEAQAAS